MDDAVPVFLTVVALLVLVFILGIGYGGKAVMREALDRGYAVECRGKSGIYWECE